MNHERENEEEADYDLFTLLSCLYFAAKRNCKPLKPSLLLLFLLCYFTFLWAGADIFMPGGLSKPLKKNLRSGAKGQAKLIASNEEEGMIMAEFGRRKKKIHDTCEAHGAFTTKEKLLAKVKLEMRNATRPGQESPEQLWNLLKKTSHHQFFIQKDVGLMWCKVPKAASTSWLHAYLTMAGVPEWEIPDENGMGLHGLLREKYPLLSKNLNKQYVPTSLKFVVVRHPFERITSAYLDKLADYGRDLKYRGGYYYAMYGGDIVANYREIYQKKFPKHSLFMQKEPSFVEFVNYIIDNSITTFDEHWRPQFLLCPPCFFKFDIIVKMETFDRDTNFMLKKKELLDVISLKKKHSVRGEKKKDIPTKADPREKLFPQLSKNMVRALYEKYKIDFEMFEYDMNDYLSLASDSEGLLPDTMPN